MPQRLALYHSALVLDDPVENHRESEDVLDNALAGGGNSEGPLNGAEHLARRTQVETARVANGKDRSLRGVGHDRGLEISESVGVERPVHFRGVADDLSLVTGPLVGRDVADLAVFEAEGLHVRLRFGLPPRRDKTARVVTAAVQMVQRKRSLSHMSQPSFGGGRFLLLGQL